jgi:hypothetical protein
MAARPACSATAYDPLCVGSRLTYQVQSVTGASWDTVNHQLIVAGTESQGVPQPSFTYEVTAKTCAGRQFFANNLVWDGSERYQADAQWTSDNGVAYIGEAWGPGQMLSTGEPLITVLPVAGETIHTTYARSGGCGETLESFPGFSTDYWTVFHYENWNGYADVWETSLLETNTASPSELTYYTYFWARGIGMVQVTCWQPVPNPAECYGLQFVLTAASGLKAN